MLKRLFQALGVLAVLAVVLGIFSVLYRVFFIGMYADSAPIYMTFAVGIAFPILLVLAAYQIIRAICRA